MSVMERPGTPFAAARDVWSRAIAQLDVGTLSERGYETAQEKLRAIRDTLERPDRSRIDVYRELLAEAWQDHSPAPPPVRTPGTSSLLVRAHRILASGFAEGGEREARRRRARAALRQLERLAAVAADDDERLRIVRLADPLLRLLSALDQAPAGEVVP